MINKLYKIVIILFVGLLVFFGLRWYFNTDDELDRFELTETPITIEAVKEIAQLFTITFEDEVVVDSIEYYKSKLELLEGLMDKMKDPAYLSRPDYVKRRLCLTSTGKILYGVDLKNEDFKVYAQNDTVYIQLPEPKVLEFIQNPKNNKIVIENGSWKDAEVKRLYLVARKKILRHFEKANPKEKAVKRTQLLFEKLIPNKPIVFSTKK